MCIRESVCVREKARACVCVCVCACVREREKEREGERGREREQVGERDSRERECVRVCEREREREDASARKAALREAASSMPTRNGAGGREEGGVCGGDIAGERKREKRGCARERDRGCVPV